MPFTPITITDSALAGNATSPAVTGLYVFTLISAMADGTGKRIAEGEEVIGYLYNGALSLSATAAEPVKLAANTDPTTVPQGTTWRVVETIDDVTRAWLLSVPHNAPGGTLDLATVAPALSGTAGYAYALDSNVVHRTGAETVAGVKTFTSLPLLPADPTLALQAATKQYVDGQSPTPADASTTVKGVTRLSVAPVSATAPIAVGDNDPRNSDARAPTAHAHSQADVTNLAADLAAKLTAVTRTAVKTGNYAAAAGDLVPADASGGSFTITLPTAPANRTLIAVAVIGLGANLVTVACGGSDVMSKTGGPTSRILGVIGEVGWFQYDSATALWTVSEAGASSVAAVTSDIVFRSRVAGDAFDRLQIVAGGSSNQGVQLKVGNGTAVPGAGAGSGYMIGCAPLSSVSLQIQSGTGVQILALAGYDFLTTGLTATTNHAALPALTATAAAGQTADVVRVRDSGSVNVFRVTAANSVVLGKSTALALAANDGHVYYESCAGTPTGTPTAIGVAVPTVIDTTGSKLWAYIGGTWKSVTFT